MHVPDQFLHFASPKKVIKFALHDEGGRNRENIEHNADADEDEKDVEKPQRRVGVSIDISAYPTVVIVITAM